MLTNISGINSLAGYQDQLTVTLASTIDKKDSQTSVSDTENKDDTVNISQEANELQQTYQEKKRAAKQNYESESQKLKREYLEEKNRLEKEYNQRRRALAIDIYT